MLFAFLTRRVRTWLLLAVAAPLVGRVLEAAGGRMEARRGETATSRRLRSTGDLLGRRAARVLRRRDRGAGDI